LLLLGREPRAECLLAGLRTLLVGNRRTRFGDAHRRSAERLINQHGRQSLHRPNDWNFFHAVALQ
jgi:hypothetical protein